MKNNPKTQYMGLTDIFEGYKTGKLDVKFTNQGQVLNDNVELPRDKSIKVKLKELAKLNKEERYIELYKLIRLIIMQQELLKNYDSIQADKCCECEHRAIQKYTDYALLINDICELLNCEENEIIDKIKKILTNS